MFLWFAPALLARAASGATGAGQYSAAETGEQRLRRVQGLVTLLADWAAEAI